MGHFLFIALHFIALLFGAVWLFVTIPAHLIYGATRGNKPRTPNEWTHVKCPECKELVRYDANICKHCGTRLVPQPKPTVWDWLTRPLS